MKVYGPYTRTDGRKHVIRYESATGKHTTVSYPKFLLEQHLGRKLEEWETADHINEDFTDNRIENLQVLSRADNIRKSAKPIEMYTFVCPVCGLTATKQMRNIRGNQGAQKKAGPYCSRSCAGIASHGGVRK